MFEVIYGPVWLTAVDSLIDGVSALVLVALALTAWRYSRIDSSGKRYKGLALAFMFIAVAFLAKIGFDYLLHQEFAEVHNLVVRFSPGVEWQDWLMDAAFYAFKFLLLIGLYVLYSIYDRPSRGQFAIVAVLFAFIVYFSSEAYFVFHALALLLCILIAALYVSRARDTKNPTTTLLAIAFCSLGVSEFLFVIVRVHLYVYLAARALQLIGFVLLLSIFIVLHRHASLNGKKTLKA
jgi:hypothetical protein